jgi:hypothetical protein
MFQRHVLLQCDFILRDFAELDTALKAGDTARVFYAIQSLLSSQANISKALWGEGGRLAQEREPIRNSIDVSDTSPFKSTAMRNNYDHFDERLTRWWRDSKRHNFVALIVGPRHHVGADDQDVFRGFDPASGKAFFWDQEYDVYALIKEVQRVLPKLKAETAKPHWE